MNSLSDKFIHLYQKAEKLSSAVFMVSNFMSDGEDLKNNIRHLALDLVSVSVMLKDDMSDNKLKNVISLEATTLKLMSFLEIAFVSGMISEMNARILKEEFKGFLGVIQNYSMFYYSSVDDLLKDFSLKQSPVDKSLPGASDKNSLPLFGMSQKDLIKGDKGQSTKNNKLSRKESRGKNIMDFIANKEFVSIKDIVQNIKGCSEKTIQRELSKLVKEGLVKKEGERRWTRYSALK